MVAALLSYLAGKSYTHAILSAFLACGIVWLGYALMISSSEGKMVNSSGLVMNMVVTSTSSEMEILTESRMSRKNVGSGTSMTNRMVTTPPARNSSPFLE